MSECGAPHEDADVTGIHCQLPQGHRGQHEAIAPITWDDPLEAIGAGPLDPDCRDGKCGSGLHAAVGAGRREPCRDAAA